MKTSATDTIAELKDFVVTQAAEDAVLPSKERSYQEELVTDVLNQEAPNGKAFEELVKLYKTEKQAA